LVTPNPSSRSSSAWRRNIPVETEIVGAPAPLDAPKLIALFCLWRVKRCVMPWPTGVQTAINIRLNFDAPQRIRMGGWSTTAAALNRPAEVHRREWPLRPPSGLLERIEQLGGASVSDQPSRGKATRIIAQLPLPGEVKA